MSYFPYFLILISAILILHTIWDYLESIHIQKLPETCASIIEISTTTYRHNPIYIYTYEYKINGKTFTTNRHSNQIYTGLNKNRSQELMAKYILGKTETARYKTTNPLNVYLDSDHKPIYYYMAFIFLGLFISALAIHVILNPTKILMFDLINSITT